MRDRIVNIIEAAIHDDGIGVEHTDCHRSAEAVLEALHGWGYVVLLDERANR